MTATPTARTIDVATLRSRLGEDAPRILDVRTLAEFETARIPGACNVPLDLLREHRDELIRHIGEDVVLVCRSGARASQAQHALSQVGLPGLRLRPAAGPARRKMRRETRDAGAEFIQCSVEAGRVAGRDRVRGRASAL